MPTVKELPKLKGKEKTYYFDAKLKQLRNVENPNDFIELEPDAAALVAVSIAECQTEITVYINNEPFAARLITPPDCHNCGKPLTEVYIEYSGTDAYHWREAKMEKALLPESEWNRIEDKQKIGFEMSLPGDRSDYDEPHCSNCGVKLSDEERGFFEENH